MVPDNGVRTEDRDRVRYITIDRADHANALTLAAQNALIEQFSDASSNSGIWLVVITGAGERAFCSGRDLKELSELGRDPKFNPSPMQGGKRNLYEVVLETYKPTIAVVNGAAVGGGFELALACDLRIAVDSAVFGLPEAKRGMGANAATAMLPRLVGRSRALEMLYTAENIDVATAAGWGLVNRVVPREQLAAATDELVASIMKNAPLSLQRYKHMISKGADLPLERALRLDAGPNPYASEDRREGVQAFVEGRTPVWRGL